MYRKHIFPIHNKVTKVKAKLLMRRFRHFAMDFGLSKPCRYTKRYEHTKGNGKPTNAPEIEVVSHVLMALGIDLLGKADLHL